MYLIVELYKDMSNMPTTHNVICVYICVYMLHTHIHTKLYSCLYLQSYDMVLLQIEMHKQNIGQVVI